MTLSANTRYLLEHSGVRPDATPQDVLIRAGRTIREAVRRWWLQLDPEHTAGVSVELLEGFLLQLARTLARAPRPQMQTYLAIGQIAHKLVSIHGRAEQTIAKRLLDGAERLGVLKVGGSVSFAHPWLLELYLGLAFQVESGWPAELAKEPLFSVKPVERPWGRAVWARLRFTEPEALDEAFGHVAGCNLHLASWYLYCDPEARERLGEAFAASLLALTGWDASLSDPQALDRMLASLGPIAAGPARACLFERDATLPEVWLAAQVLGRCGDAADAERLAALAADPALGRWEVERMRQAIREAQTLTLEPEVLRRYRREELVEFAKGALAFLALIGGAILVAQLKVGHRVPGLPAMSHSTSESVAHGLGHGVTHGFQHLAHDLANDSPNDVLALQRTLREKLAFLPAEIEKRKAAIDHAQPGVREALRRAAAAIAARGPGGGEPPPAAGG